MTLRYLDSFDSFATGDGEKSYLCGSGLDYIYIRDTSKYVLRPGSKVAELYGTASWAARRYLYSGEGISACLIGFKKRWGPGSGPDSEILTIGSASGEQLQFTLNADGSIICYRGGITKISVSKPDLIRAGSYQQFEFKIKLHDTLGNFYIRIDGEDVYSGENIDTKYYAGHGMNWFETAGSYGDLNVVEDLFFCDLSGEFNVNFINGLRVDCLHPNAPGYHADWTPDSGANWDRVDDEGDIDTTSYVASSTDGHYDTYHFDDLSVLSGETTILGVQVKMFVRDDQISGEIIPVFYDGTKYTGSGERSTRNWAPTYALETGHEYYGKTPWVWDRDPGGGAWSASTINSGEFGIELNIP